MSEERKDGESGESGSNTRSGDEVLRDLRIPMQTMVYCPLTDVLLHVTDRSTAVGLCCHQDPQTEFYLTADELYAVRHSVNFNYQFGFAVSIPNQSVFDQYSLPRQHTVQLTNGTQFLYSRNFQIFAGGFNLLHQKLGYLLMSLLLRRPFMSEPNTIPFLILVFKDGWISRIVSLSSYKIPVCWIAKDILFQVV
jgi:hypothetical protein